MMSLCNHRHHHSVHGGVEHETHVAVETKVSEVSVAETKMTEQQAEVAKICALLESYQHLLIRPLYARHSSRLTVLMGTKILQGPGILHSYMERGKDL